MLVVKGTAVPSGMKNQLASQLYDGILHDYMISKEEWTQYTFFYGPTNEILLKKSFIEQTGQHQQGMFQFMVYREQVWLVI
jgi:hypothetical protein